MLGICNKGTSDACSLLAEQTLYDLVGEPPEFINYQLWISYKKFVGLKYLFLFFGWLHFCIRVLKSNCMSLSCHVRVSE